jgi:cyclopropane fatty-acyl-phospholipid synthase-like methyltransferase
MPPRSSFAGKNWVASEAAHEARVAVELGLRPGMKVLDCGCGVGGPMRTVASVSGAHVTGAESCLVGD